MKLPPKTSVVYATSGGGSAAKSSEGSDDHAKLAAWAKGLLNQHDANQNGVLEKDEWKNLKTEHQSADTNKDNVITLEELTAKIASYASSSSTSSSASTGSAPASSGGPQQGRRTWGNNGPGGKPGDKEKGDTRKSYRVATATERLPKGLPDWFARNDTDADGQVMMSEYMTEFTETKAADFAKYDINSDGVITPSECLEIEGKTKKK